MLDLALASMLTETITLAPYQGEDAYGAPLYGPAQAHAARLDWRVVQVLTPTGTERRHECLLFLAGTVAVDVRDRVTLADGSVPMIQRVMTMRDETGVVSHQEVLL